MDLPNIAISEGGGKRHKPSSSPLAIGVNQAEVDQPGAEYEDEAGEGSGTANVFLALTNRGNVNKNGTMDEMDWYEMVQEEVQYQMNDADKSDICEIDIISHYWESNNGNLMVKVSGLYGIGDDTVEAEYVNIDYPYTLEPYILGSSIWEKSSWKLIFSKETNGWRKWSEKFANAKTICMATLVRFLGINFLDEIFISQSTLAMLQPLRFQKSFLERLSKPGGRDWSHTNRSNIKYGTKFPRNTK